MEGAVGGERVGRVSVHERQGLPCRARKANGAPVVGGHERQTVECVFEPVREGDVFVREERSIGVDCSAGIEVAGLGLAEVAQDLVGSAYCLM